MTRTVNPNPLRRVIDQNWYKTSAAIDEYKYGYDADANVLWKQNMVSSTNSELYADNSGNAYDGLNRLQHFQRGTLSAGHDSISGSAGKTTSRALMGKSGSPGAIVFSSSQSWV